MSFKRVLFPVFAVLLVNRTEVKAQVSEDQVIEALIESVAEDAGENFDYTDLAERLAFYSKHPLNLNRASADQLKELLFLSPAQIEQILAHRLLNGSLLDLTELQSIDALDLETIRKLAPFVTVGEQNSLSELNLRKMADEGRNDLMLTFSQVIERQKGYLRNEESGPKYEGSPQRFLSRYRYRYSNTISASITMEKDAGESFFSSSQPKGFDFYSANIFVKDAGIVKKAVIGDYSLQFGQGLSLWSGLGFGKGAAIASVVKNEIGLRPYSSTNELLFFRGIAATLKWKRVEMTPFVSTRNIDGSSSDEIEEEPGLVSSLSQTGLHRTTTEIKNKGSINQTVYGINTQFDNTRVKIGGLAYRSSFSRFFEEKKELYNSFRPASSTQITISSYYTYNLRNFYLFGEFAHSMGSGNAFLSGALISLSPQVSSVMLYRNYGRNYQSSFNQAIAESSGAVNEKGIYYGLIINPTKKIELLAYADYFRFPWLRYRVDAPSLGQEILSQASFTPSKKLKVSLRYKLENKEENDAEENTQNFLEEVRKRSYRFEISYKINWSFNIRNRAEVCTYKKGTGVTESGYLVFQDLVYHPMKSRFSGNVRFALFDTRTYNTRIYAYENDVLFGFSAPAYYDTGSRFYINGRYRIKRGLDLWLRYAQSYFTELEEIGSGMDEIAGNRKSDVKLQLRYQF